MKNTKEDATLFVRWKRFIAREGEREIKKKRHVESIYASRFELLNRPRAPEHAKTRESILREGENNKRGNKKKKIEFWKRAEISKPFLTNFKPSH